MPYPSSWKSAAGPWEDKDFREASGYGPAGQSKGHGRLYVGISGFCRVILNGPENFHWGLGRSLYYTYDNCFSIELDEMLLVLLSIQAPIPGSGV